MEMRDVVGYEGRYSVTDDGRIYSHIQHKFLHLQKNNQNGYMQIILCSGKDKITHYVHRIVCRAFHGNPSDGEEVNHINFNRVDNRAENLEWVSRPINLKKTRDAGRFPIDGRKRGAQTIARIKSRKIYGIDKDGNRIDFNSLMDAQRNGFRASCISMCIHGKQSNHKGYVWFFNNDVGMSK